VREVTDCRIRTTCRLCEGPLHLGLQLTPTPPANELVTKEFVDSGQKQECFPLDVMVCGECAHVQLSAVVNPERLFRQYPYRSGASAQFVAHLEAQARSLRALLPTWRHPFVVEIGSNDGTFLKAMHQYGVNVLGVDPADNIAAIADQTKEITIREFFTRDLAHRIRGDHGKADMVVANHVFAHADDLRGIVHGVRELLTDDGVFVFEVGYLLDVLDGNLFDTMYAEHCSYHHLWPLARFFHAMGMDLYDAERVDTQGGAIRCYVRQNVGTRSERFLALLFEEKKRGMHEGARVRLELAAMGKRIDERTRQLWEFLSGIARAGKTVCGYGAPAKATTLLHHMGFNRATLPFVVDDSPLKHGLHIPGKNIPILPVDALYERKPGYALILAWNFADQIMANNKRFAEQGGTWIVPLPELRTMSVAKVMA
jgi:predicted TPR repeat methyltransferase